MKISVMGFSGSGKSTFSKLLKEKYNIPCLHLDTVHFTSNWQERDKEEKNKIIEDFLNYNDSWVIDGNYSHNHFERRIEESDKIYIFLYNRFLRLHRVIKRYKKYKNSVREDIAEGCKEKIDFKFFTWVFFRGCSRRKKRFFYEIKKKYPDKVVIFKKPKEYNNYIKTFN